MTDLTSERKRDHLRLAMADTSQSTAAPGWDDVVLVPRALPGIDPGDVSLRTPLLGRELGVPVVLSGMTGGHPEATELNAILGEAAELTGAAVGVGSQRAALDHPELVGTYSAVRRRAPHAVVLANIGACQLVAQSSTPALTDREVTMLVEMVGADALAVHLNVVQELVQPEGDRSLRDLAEGIARTVQRSPVPVLVKETGAGIDRESAQALAATGVAALDVGGAGGTSFARIEAERARQAGLRAPADLGTTFAGWGIPTAASVLEAVDAGVPVVATGGIRSGLDAARALALGATAVGVGRPAITAAAAGGTAAVVALVEQLVTELRTAMVLCGCATPPDLARRGVVLGGATRDWVTQRGLPGRGGSTSTSS